MRRAPCSAAFTAHGGTWVTGRLVGVADSPQVIVEDSSGELRHYTLSTITGWAAAREARAS